jgi:RNA polymerase sigma-70 factor (ECF subfamily)
VTDADFPRLLAGLRAGDPAAAEAICRRYEPFLRAAIRRQLDSRLRARLDSVDIVQDVWASFLAIPAERLNFASPAALLAFLSQVAYHRVIEVFRKRFGTQKDDFAREVPVEVAVGARDRLPGSEPTPSMCASAGEEWERLVRQFPPGHRAILLRLREGHQYEDIARMANVSLSTVNRVVRRLKELTGLKELTRS